jgi:hypothetical protein
LGNRLVSLTLRRKRKAQLISSLRFYHGPGLIALYALTEIMFTACDARLLLCQPGLVEAWLDAEITATPLEFFARPARTGIVASRIRHWFGAVLISTQVDPFRGIIFTP